MINKKLVRKIQKLSDKYSATGQDMLSFLDGLLYADYMGYWDYLKIDTLLSLQSPKTDFPDEKIFITYHQITELYFKLIIWEIEQISNNGKNILDSGKDAGWHKALSADLFIEKMQRINRYIRHLIDSFDIMTDGMQKKEFLKFRMALLPSSGFQSAQYRTIEIQSTDLKNLAKTKSIKKENISNLYNAIYWKGGAMDVHSGQKNYTLLQFEKKYDKKLMQLSTKFQKINIWQKYNSLSSKDQENKMLIKLLRQYDELINIHWKLAHYKSVVKYLKKSDLEIAATGGTNWKKYLPPKFQKIIFFPNLWSAKEKNNWGKNWVDTEIT